MGIAAVFALSFNVLLGQTGLLSFGHAVYFGLGAYATIHLMRAVNGGLLTIDEVCERYNLTLEEFASWQRAVDRSGMQGLRVTRIQHYRDLYERQLKY